MPFSATSELVVMDIKLPDRILKIGETRQFEPTTRRMLLLNLGDSATADRLKMWRRSVADDVQLPRSKRLLSGFVKPVLPDPEFAVVFHQSLMQCDNV